MRVMSERELNIFRKNVREFYAAICQNGAQNDVEKIRELLHSYRLRKDDLINNYTVEFEK